MSERSETIAKRISEWHPRTWPDADESDVFEKLAEEAGEVGGAMIRGTTWEPADELADVQIASIRLAQMLYGDDFDWLDNLERRFRIVSARKYPPPNGDRPSRRKRSQEPASE